MPIGLIDWNHADREFPAAEIAVDDVLGEEVERAAGLLEEAPEEDVEDEERDHREHFVALHIAFADTFDDHQQRHDDEHRSQQRLQRTADRFGEASAENLAIGPATEISSR